LVVQVVQEGQEGRLEDHLVGQLVGEELGIQEQVV
jgi:hypothetical protein